jgi:opacity protein-like surface antigen
MRAVFSVLVLLLLCSLWPRGAAAQADPPPLPPSTPPPLPAAAPQPMPTAPVAPMMASEPEPYARFNRFAISFGFGFGSVAMGELHDLAEGMISVLGVQGDAPTSGLQINSEVAFRYYFPYYVLAQVGYDAVYNWASSSVSVGGLGSATIKNWNLAMEIPILVGGYYPFIKRLYVYGAIGPSVFFYPRCWWDAEPGGIDDFKADPGVGFHALAGADFLLADHFALGLELRYRYLKTGELKHIEYGTEISKLGAGLPKTNLDFSGISLGIVMRFYVL